MSLIAISAITGAFIGLMVLSPLLIVSKSEPSLLFSWILSGVVSGSITITIVVLIYRKFEEPLVGNIM